MSARLASVSTFWMSVGRPRTPRSNGRGGVKVGLAGPPFSQCTSALSSPATKRSGTDTSSICSRAPRLGALVDGGREGSVRRRCVASDRDDDRGERP